MMTATKKPIPAPLSKTAETAGTQVRVSARVAKELVIEAKTQSTSIKDLVEFLWDSRKDEELRFFPFSPGIESSLINDDNLVYLRLCAEILSRPPEDRDREGLTWTLEMFSRTR